jgi:putative spermidine/putrescine transport system substrate-binding protein
MSAYFLSYVLAYDSELYQEAPTALPDFFDVEPFPGPRTM